MGASILDHPSPRVPAAPSSTQAYSSLDQWSQSRPPATSTSTGSLPAIPVGKPPPTKSSYTSVHACSTAFLPRLMTCRHNDTSYIIHLCAYRIIIMHVGVDICACVDIYGQRVWSSLISKASATLFAGLYFNDYCQCSTPPPPPPHTHAHLCRGPGSLDNWDPMMDDFSSPTFNSYDRGPGASLSKAPVADVKP